MKPDFKYRTFISHKKTDEDGSETKDSLLAQQIHSMFTSRGVSSFLATDSVAKLGETEFMRVIDKALEEADVLIIVATSEKNLNSRWVRYEWESFGWYRRIRLRKQNIQL